MLEHVFMSHLWFEDGWWGHEKMFISYPSVIIIQIKATVSELES